MLTEVQNMQANNMTINTEITNENLSLQIPDENIMPPRPPSPNGMLNQSNSDEQLLTISRVHDLRRKIQERNRLLEEEEKRKIREREEIERRIAAIDNNFQPGEFLYINCQHSRKLIKNGWRAVKQTETENFVRTDIESFQWSDDPRISIIINKMESIEDPPGHSGFTFGWTMRQLQQIFKLGEEEYRRRILIEEIRRPVS